MYLTFFVKLSLHDNQKSVKIGHRSVIAVTIVNNNGECIYYLYSFIVNYVNLFLPEPSTFEFAQPIYVVNESIDTFEIEVESRNGADGDVSIRFLRYFLRIFIKLNIYFGFIDLLNQYK